MIQNIIHERWTKKGTKRKSIFLTTLILVKCVSTLFLFFCTIVTLMSMGKEWIHTIKLQHKNYGFWNQIIFCHHTDWKQLRPWGRSYSWISRRASSLQSCSRSADLPSPASSPRPGKPSPQSAPSTLWQRSHCGNTWRDWNIVQFWGSLSTAWSWQSSRTIWRVVAS